MTLQSRNDDLYSGDWQQNFITEHDTSMDHGELDIELPAAEVPEFNESQVAPSVELATQEPNFNGEAINLFPASLEQQEPGSSVELYEDENDENQRPAAIPEEELQHDSCGLLESKKMAFTSTMSVWTIDSGFQSD